MLATQLFTYLYFIRILVLIFWFFFQVKFSVQNIIQVPNKLLWMRWDRLSFAKVAYRIRRTWALQSRVFNRFSFKKKNTTENFGDGVKKILKFCSKKNWWSEVKWSTAPKKIFFFPVFPFLYVLILFFMFITYSVWLLISQFFSLFLVF